MLEIRFIRENPERVQAAARDKGYDVSIADLLARDDERRELQKQVDELRQKRNEIAAQMKDGKPEPSMIEQGKQIKEQLAALETELADPAVYANGGARVAEIGREQSRLRDALSIAARDTNGRAYLAKVTVARQSPLPAATGATGR